MIFNIIAIVVNTVIMNNLVIAILTDTYSSLASFTLGLYYDSIIASIPSMKYNKNWGYMILMPSPFNILHVPFMPFWFCKYS